MMRISDRIKAYRDFILIPIEVGQPERVVLEELIGDFCGKIVPFSIIKNQVNPWTIFMLSSENRKDADICGFELRLDNDDIVVLRQKCGESIIYCIHDLVDFLSRVLNLIHVYRLRRVKDI